MIKKYFIKKLTATEADINRELSGFFPKLHETYRENEDEYGKFDFVEGRTLHQCLLKTGSWPYTCLEEFNQKFIGLIDFLICLARHSEYRHNDIHPKNIIIDDYYNMQLVDLGLSQTNRIIPTFPKHFINRNHTSGQLKTFFFRRLPGDYSNEVFDLHNGDIDELDITNLINLLDINCL